MLNKIYTHKEFMNLMKPIKKLCRNFLSKFGYEISRKSNGIKNDQNLYVKCFSEDSIKNKRFYNIGAGSFSHPFWTNIDYESDWYIKNKNNTRNGVQYDLLSLNPIPINSNSAEIVYSSHTIEHITDEAAQFVFDEVYRILKNKGVFRLTTPNIELAYRAFKENDLHYFHHIYRYSSNSTIVNGIEVIKDKTNTSIEQLFLFHFASSISSLHNFGEKKLTDNEIKNIFNDKDLESALNYCTALCPLEIQKKFPGNHINWWKKEKIFKMLRKTGFNKIFLSQYGQSFSPILRNTNYFDNTHSEMSLYVEAIK